MELKIYLKIILTKWWVVLSTFLVTLTTTVILTFTQVPTYSSTATFVISPSSSFGDVRSFASGLSILSSQSEIATTYTEVAVSRLIRNKAVDSMQISRDQVRGLSVDSKLRAGTNVIEITVQGSEPELVMNFANAIGTEMMIYVQDLYETYTISSLDYAVLPGCPIKPNKMLNLALGGIGGGALGIGLAFLATYLETPLEKVTNLAVLDSEVGVYNRRYFMQRLGEEMARAKRNRYSLSLTLMNVDHLDALNSSLPSKARGEVLRKIAFFLNQHLREEDVMARMDDTVFAFMLPDMPVEDAKAVMERLQTKVAWTPFEIERSGIKLNLNATTGIVAYNYNGTGQDELLARANYALQQAELAGYGKVFSFSESETESFDARGTFLG